MEPFDNTKDKDWTLHLEYVPILLLRVPFMEIVLITLENAGSCAGAIAGKPRTW